MFQGTSGGSILDNEHTEAFLRLLEGGSTGDSKMKKTAAAFYFHEHVVSIINVQLDDGMFVYDIVESSPPGSRVRCQDIDVVAALLKSHAFKMFQSSDVGKLAPVEFNKDTAKDHPAVFQAFVWAETNGSLSANTAIVGTGEENDNHIGDARLHSTVTFAVDVEQQRSETSITSEEWMTPTKSHWIISPVSILKLRLAICFQMPLASSRMMRKMQRKVPEEKAEPVAQMTTHSAEQQETSKQKEKGLLCLVLLDPREEIATIMAQMKDASATNASGIVRVEPKRQLRRRLKLRESNFPERQLKKHYHGLRKIPSTKHLQRSRKLIQITVPSKISFKWFLACQNFTPPS
jgi:hypothetical protein